MRFGRPCKVLESTNPQPTPQSYAKVVSWIDSETGALIRAEAYDSQKKLYKIFSLKGFAKIHGQWQVREMEIRNDRTDSRTQLELVFQPEQ